MTFFLALSKCVSFCISTCFEIGQSSRSGSQMRSGSTTRRTKFFNSDLSPRKYKRCSLNTSTKAFSLISMLIILKNKICVAGTCVLFENTRTRAKRSFLARPFIHLSCQAKTSASSKKDRHQEDRHAQNEPNSSTICVHHNSKHIVISLLRAIFSLGKLFRQSQCGINLLRSKWLIFQIEEIAIKKYWRLMISE